MDKKRVKRRWFRSRIFWWVLLGAVVINAVGCGSFVASRIAQAPNTYPTWFAPKAPVSIGISSKVLDSFPTHVVDIGPPHAKMHYRIVEPADYDTKLTATNWLDHGKRQFSFRVHAKVPGTTNSRTGAPRGTVILLHGYGLAQFSMAPWALRLAEEGWRCVMVDLRGHGTSTGNRIYFGVQETYDMSRLLDQMERDGTLAGPVVAMGESYGAALALRWEGVEPRLRTVVAIAPYAVLADSVMNIAKEYSGNVNDLWKPWEAALWVGEKALCNKAVIGAGMRKLPRVLEVPADELNMTTVLERHPVRALFVAADEDKISPKSDVGKLYKLASPGSEMIVVPHATHEAVTYFFNDLVPPVLTWFGRADVPRSTLADKMKLPRARD